MVAVLYVGLCIVSLLWGGVICRAEKGLVLWFFDVLCVAVQMSCYVVNVVV